MTTLTRWNRCTSQCGCDRNPSYYSSCRCKGGCERGSADRLQLLHYALEVTLSMMGGMTCPLTGQPFDITDSEVDRVDASKGYEPGNVVLVSLIGNSGRGTLQGNGQDISAIKQYRDDVRRASASVNVKRKRDLTPLPKRSRRSLSGVNANITVALVERGPYGA